MEMKMKVTLAKALKERSRLAGRLKRNFEILSQENSKISGSIRSFDLKALMAEKEAEYTKLFANPYNAAKYGYIDDVIEPRNTRFRVIRALQQLQTKKQTNPAKKHGNIPL